MEDSDLLQALLQVPPNLKFVQEQLLSGQYSPQQVTELGYQYAEECWKYHYPLRLSWPPPEAIRVLLNRNNRSSVLAESWRTVSLA